MGVKVLDTLDMNVLLISRNKRKVYLLLGLMRTTRKVNLRRKLINMLLL